MVAIRQRTTSIWTDYAIEQSATPSTALPKQVQAMFASNGIRTDSFRCVRQRTSR
jgi:hypothetical protein